MSKEAIIRYGFERNKYPRNKKRVNGSDAARVSVIYEKLTPPPMRVARSERTQLRDDSATVAVCDQDARAWLQVEDSLRRGDIVLQRGQWLLTPYGFRFLDAAREAFEFTHQPLVRPDVFADLESYALRARSRMMVQRLYQCRRHLLPQMSCGDQFSDHSGMEPVGFIFRPSWRRRVEPLRL